MSSKSIGVRLKEERERLGLNQTVFSERGGVTRKTQFNYENGSRAGDTEYLERIAEMGADIVYIMTGHRSSMEGTPPGEDGQREMEMLRRFRRANRSLQDMVLKALE